MPTEEIRAPSDGLTIEIASEADREQIYRCRHEIYARELGQHAVNENAQLCDVLDDFNTYLVVSADGELAGFISITPPTHGRLSIDKYLPRDALPVPIDDATYEIRLLTVLSPHRSTAIAALLMYGAYRFIDSQCGTRVVVMGRRELRQMYTKTGLEPLGIDITSGAVEYEVLSATMERVRQTLDQHALLVERLNDSDWRLPFPVRAPVACFHGGAFFDAIGDRFETLAVQTTVVNADVLDAWFPPAPSVLAALSEHLPWVVRTSPPADAAGMIGVIGDVRGVDPACLLAGAGSSALIFLAFSRWLNPRSRVLLLDPTYGEYAHVLQRVVRCHVDRLLIHRDQAYELNANLLISAAGTGYDLIVLVNPNSPTGRHMPRSILEAALAAVPATTRVWIDETYVEYVGAHESLEAFAARSRNVVVCKSMSKTYALSGLRIAYLCARPDVLGDLRQWTPPWAVGLASQIAAVRALQEPDYYADRYRQTHDLRCQLAGELRASGLDVVPSVANFLLCHLEDDAPTAGEVVALCQREGVFLRDAGTMGSVLGQRCLRIAVKNTADNRRIAAAIEHSLAST